jgi:sigma-E factor negative regulatory protein RseA
MSNGSESGQSLRENLSALSDGELDSAAAARACAAWREDASMRSSWHAYQLIGDVLRSEDLAADAAGDARFLASLRLRLADEPVVLAPEPALEPAAATVQASNGARSTRWSWMAPGAVAAGFVLVAGALLVTRAPTAGTPGTASVLAGAATALPQVAKVDAVPTLAASDTRFEPASLIRDPRLDRYLDAHKQFAGSSALGVPSGFLRNAAAEAPGSR